MIVYIKIRYFIPLFNGVPGRKSYGGSQDCYVHTNYTTDYSYSDSANYMYIYTEYPNAWYEALVNESRGILREYVDNDYIDVDLIDTVTPNRIEIKPDDSTLNIELTISEIGLQVGPGYAVSNN